jgi:hypothetical protein
VSGCRISITCARCFVARKESPAAIEALKEELRYFPENHEAGKMLADLLPQNTAEFASRGCRIPAYS